MMSKHFEEPISPDLDPSCRTRSFNRFNSPGSPGFSIRITPLTNRPRPLSRNQR